MICLDFKEISKFMSMLLSHETFDEFLTESVKISTYVDFAIDGHFHSAFFENEEDRPMAEYATWQSLRPVSYDLIKGKRTPLSVKIIFEAPDSIKEKVLGNEAPDIHLLMNIVFENASLRVITASSTDTFLPDKSFEKEWDSYVEALFNSLSLSFENIL